MNRILLSLYAIAMCINVNAASRLFPYQEKAGLTYLVGKGKIDGTNYKLITFKVDDAATAEAQAFSLYFDYADKSKIKDVKIYAAGDLAKNGKHDFVYSTSSNYPSELAENETYSFCTAFTDPTYASTSKSLEALGAGKYCTLYIEDDATGTLSVDGIVSLGSTGYNLNYCALDLGSLVSSYTLSDANGDGEVNTTDAAIIISYYLNGSYTGIDMDAADANSDGEINTTDATVVINTYLNNK